jgi:hypothetical protein
LKFDDNFSLLLEKSDPMPDRIFHERLDDHERDFDFIRLDILRNLILY